jgi:hypothetical protein
VAYVLIFAFLIQIPSLLWKDNDSEVGPTKCLKYFVLLAPISNRSKPQGSTYEC